MNDMEKRVRNGLMRSLPVAILVVVSATFASPTLANTGRVDFTVGNVVMTTQDGRAQALAKGMEVGSGDKITSGSDGRAQIRFSDGAYVSLQPNTEFDIKEYRYGGRTDGTESAIFGLFKGALRTVTGLVGRVNRNKYQITTPTATIGIRGTGGLVQVNSDGSTLVTGTSGIWSLANNGGSLDIPAGTAGFAGANRNAPPQPSTDQPVLPPAQAATTREEATFVQGNTVTPQGTPPLVPVLTSGSGYVAALSEGLSATDHGIVNPNPATAVFNAAGQLTEISYTTSGPFDFLLAGTQADFGTADGVIAWGRWTGDVLRNGAALTGTFSDNQGFHYVIGTPTLFANLPASGTFTYNLIGASRPTFADGLTAPGTLTSAQLTGDFLARTVAVQLSATAGGFQFDGTASGLAINNTNGNAVFGGAGRGTGTGCASGCTLDITGFFAGSAATHAGISYDFGNTSQGSNLVGAAALKR